MQKNTLLLLLTTIILIIIATSTSATNWIEQTNSSTLDWSAIASSSDGTKLIAVPYSDHIFTSTNYGVTWTSQPGSGYHTFVSVTSSSDGTKLAVGNAGDDIYTSNDSGVTWTDQTGSGASQWYHIDSSSNGTWIIATNYGSDLFISNDSGVTWADHNELGGQNWVGVAMSNNGSRIATATNAGNIYISNDYGNTWTNHTLYANSTNYLNGLAMSKDGSTIGVWQATGNIYISNDSGLAWTNQTQAGSGDWASMAFSNDGTTICATQFSDTTGTIWTSNNQGTTWTEHNETALHDWASCTVSSDGTKMAAAIYNGDIWTYGSPTSCTPSWTCNAYAPCDTNNTQSCNSVTDTNNCNTTYTGNYTEYNTTYCIYCTPTWVARTGGIYDCTTNNTLLRYYDDYSACCSLSPTNCIYPIDHNTLIPCDPLTQNMTCQYDQAPYLQAKINIACYLPPAPISNDSWDCITYVRKANQTLLIQSNPEYADVPTLMFWKESERRHSFTNTGSIINAYYTNKNLETGQQFILGMKCTNQAGTVLTSEYYITPTYQPPTAFLNRLAWAGDNLGYIIIWALGIFLIILLAAWGLKKLRGR